MMCALFMLHFGSWTLSVTVCNKDKEISQKCKFPVPSFFPTNKKTGH